MSGLDIQAFSGTSPLSATSNWSRRFVCGVATAWLAGQKRDAEGFLRAFFSSCLAAIVAAKF